VWLQRRNIKSLRPSPKLDHQRLGPFPIHSQVSTHAYKLTLPPSMSIHPVFHVSLLTPYFPNSLPNRVTPPPPPIQVASHPEFEVSAILDSRIHRRQLQYLVDFTGYPPSERLWLPLSNVLNAPILLHDFHRQHPTNPRPSCLPPLPPDHT
jgi:hypothetical protein